MQESSQKEKGNSEMDIDSDEKKEEDEKSEEKPLKKGWKDVFQRELMTYIGI